MYHTKVGVASRGGCGIELAEVDVVVEVGVALLVSGGGCGISS